MAKGQGRQFVKREVILNNVEVWVEQLTILILNYWGKNVDLI